LDRHQTFRDMALLAAPLLFLLPAAVSQQAASSSSQPAPVERQAPVVRQQPAEPQALPTAPTIHIESRLVSVALNVVDAQGAPVPGLNASDFEIAEDNKPEKIAIFERESATPLDIVLAFDASESVFGDERLERDAVKSFIKSLVRPQDKVDLMSFADNVTEVVSFTNQPKRIEEGLGRIERGDATALYDAIYLASQRLGEMPAVGAAPAAGNLPAAGSLPAAGNLPAAGPVRRVVVLITDGENTTRHGSYDMALEQAERAGAMIYSLIIVPIEADAGRNTGGEHALIQMAHDTGGKFYYVEDKHDLAPAFQHVSDDLRTQYTLGYYAPQKGGDAAGLRHIQIQLKDPALRARDTLRYRTAYYANR
jgi:Ca-activated chloride channel family protein